MSSGITSCGSSRAPAPIPPHEAAATGGGAPMDVSGGGAPMKDVAGGGDVPTAYDPAPVPVPCGQQVPAPTAPGTAAPSPAPEPMPLPGGSDTPPEPMPIPGSSPAPGEASEPVATVPANQLPSWSEWARHFTQLGMSPEQVAQVGAAALTDAQLADMYEELSAGATSAPSGTTPGQPGWDAEWAQEFTALGLPPQMVQAIQAEALRTGATDAQLESIHARLAAELGGTNGTTAPADPAAAGPGWNAQYEQAFRELGMPDEIIQAYAQSGAPAAGLEAAHRHAASRARDFQERGWAEKFEAAGADPVQTWNAILADPTRPATDEELQKALDSVKDSQLGRGGKVKQLVSSLLPGGRLAQWAMGKEAVSGTEIDRSNPLEIGKAAISGVALLAGIRGGRTIGSALAARSGGYQHLQGVRATAAELGIAGPAGAADNAVAGAGSLRIRDMVGLAHADRAAKAFNEGGAKALLDSGGELQLASVTKLFDDVRTGTVKLHGKAFMPQLRKPVAPMLHSTARDGQEVVKVPSSLRLGNGNTQLTGMSEVAGTRLARDPDMFGQELGRRVSKLATDRRNALGATMGGNASRALRDSFSDDGRRALSHYRALGDAQQPAWYRQLTQPVTGPIGGGPAPDRLAHLVEVTAWNGLLDDSIRTMSGLGSRLPPGIKPLVDEAAAASAALRTALENSKAAGGLDEVANAALTRYRNAVTALDEADGELATRIFPTYFDDEAFDAAHAAAARKVGASLPNSGTPAPPVSPDTTAPAVVDDVPSSHAPTGVPAPQSPVPQAPASAPAAPATARGPVAPAAPVAAPAPRMTVSDRGEAMSGGIILPSYTAPAGGFASAADAATIRRLAELMRQVRNGG